MLALLNRVASGKFSRARWFSSMIEVGFGQQTDYDWPHEDNVTHRLLGFALCFIVA